ncbi:hypothetical protein GQ44DRAFT_743980 [Phaeosphaeriaceae sp. PMI808]|nr:hypothetical protein GQ44DRAFT_743980 [Phaeosphaeriaceae sp. PMI808]
MFILLITCLTLLFPLYTIYKPPTLLIRAFARRWPDVLWHVPSVREKIVALTIDDAPSGYTSEILAELRTHGAKATFFVIGAQVAGREHVLAEVVGGGMEVGNHAMHDEASVGLTLDRLETEMAAVETYINGSYASVGVERGQHRFFRPGSGFFSESMRVRVRELGYRMVLGSVYPHDAQIGYAAVNARHILSMVRPGAIIICHDRRSWTLPMLKIVLPELKRRGYLVTTVSGLLEAGAERERG